MAKSVSAEYLPSKKTENSIKDRLALRLSLLKRRYITVSGIKKLVVRIAMYILITGMAFVFLYPFLYMFATSLMSDSDLNSISVQWIPTALKFENYAIALELMDAGRNVLNSLFVTTVASLGHILSCSLIGYGFARYRFPCRGLLFGFVILAFIVPTQTLIIPLYMSYSNMGWLNTYLPILVPCFFGLGLNGALYIFLFRQFYLTVPKSLEEAKIDGYGFMKTYWQIVFPLAKATVVVALVLSVVWHWNEFFESSTYARSSALAFLPTRLSSIIDATTALPEQQ